MSNRQRAADVIRAHGTGPCREPECIAQDLADAGLLAPDTPEPNTHGDWELAGGVTVTADDDEIIITEPLTDEHTMICWYGHPNNARELADALYAAANHAETKQ